MMITKINRNVVTALILSVLALTLALSGCGKSAKLSPLKRDTTILAFGDSLTFGTGAATDAAYPAVLKQLIGINVVGHGVPGEISADGLARLPAVLDDIRPALMVLCHGGNDFLRKKPDSEAAANVRAMVKLARDRGIDVILLATPKPGLIVSTPAFYTDIAKEFSIPIEFDLLREILTDNSLKSDLVHPNAAGYRKIAERLADLLKKSKAL